MIPSLRLIEDNAEWGLLVELVGGEHNGSAVLLVPADRVPPGPAPRRPAVDRRRPLRFPEYEYGETHRLRKADAARRAEALLESLLYPVQLADWRRRQTFWVATPYGAVELGRLTRLGFHAADGRRFVLCVVSRGYGDLPAADMWTNLLLVLRAEPERFFAVANYCDASRVWRAGPAPLPSPSQPPGTVQRSHQVDPRALAL